MFRSKIRNYLARRLQAPEIPFALERLAIVSFRPSLIFDVGAYKGDFARQCFKVWPEARVACFEALQDGLTHLKKMQADHPNIQIFSGLLGSESREKVPFYESETASPVLTEYELEVLKGAEQSLKGMQVILAELNVLDIHQNVPLFAGLIGWLNEREWVTYDICGLTRRPLDRALWQADVIFVAMHSLLRQDKRWIA